MPSEKNFFRARIEQGNAFVYNKKEGARGQTAGARVLKKIKIARKGENPLKNEG